MVFVTKLVMLKIVDGMEMIVQVINVILNVQQHGLMMENVT